MDIIIITGKINSGKTTLMKSLVDKEKKAAQDPTGIIAPGIYKNNSKTGFNVMNISNGQTRLLASTEKKDVNRFSFGRFNFSKEGFEFAKNALLNFKPKGVVFLDEAGPLELEARGYAPCLKTLLESSISKLYISVRENCLKEFSRIFLSPNKFKVKYITTKQSTE